MAAASVFDGGLSAGNLRRPAARSHCRINTYTGNTIVAAGNTLILADNAELAFLVDGTDATKLTGAGTATLAGDFRIDTT